MDVKKRLCALGLLLLFPLSGCTAMLERSYASVQPHVQSLTGQENGSALEAQTYQQLVSAVLYLVTQHTENGVIRLYNYSGDVEADVSNACLEVVQKDPLGAFAVDYIKHSVSRIVSFHEAQIAISYLRTAEEMGQITAVTGSSAIKSELRDTLNKFENTQLLRISYYFEDDGYLHELVRQAYYDTPLAAFGMPEVSFSLYPESGTQRIVEIDLVYPLADDVLANSQLELEEAATRLIAQEIDPDAQAIYDLLLRTAQLQAGDGMDTAYAALLSGAADAEGLALAYKLLCDQAGLTCTVVQGQGAHPFWNIVTTASGSRHVDCANGVFGLTDRQMEELGGYQWRESYPICRDGSELDPAGA